MQWTRILPRSRRRRAAWLLRRPLPVLRFFRRLRVGKSVLVFWRRLSPLFPALLQVLRRHPLRRWLYPWLDLVKAGRFFGANLLAVLAFVGIVGSPAAASFPATRGLSDQVDLSVVDAPDEVIATERRYQMPVDLLGVSQGFQRYHPGVDLRAGLGSEIRPIADGVVSSVFTSLWGYGNVVIVQHAEGYSSLYAHVGKIFVEEGLSVDQDTVISQVGLTGKTSGPHLHLEIYKEGVALDPRPFLGYPSTRKPPNEL